MPNIQVPKQSHSQPFINKIQSATQTAARSGLQRTISRSGQKPTETAIQLTVSQRGSSGKFSFWGSSVSWCFIVVTHSEHSLRLASKTEPSRKLSPFPVGYLSGNTTPALYSDVHVATSSVTANVFVFTIRFCSSFKALVVLVLPCLARGRWHCAWGRSLVFNSKSAGNLVFPLCWIQNIWCPGSFSDHLSFTSRFWSCDWDCSWFPFFPPDVSSDSTSEWAVMAVLLLTFQSSLS